MRTTTIPAVVMTTWLVACGPLVLPGDTETGTGSEGEPTTTAPPGTTTAPPGTTSPPPPPMMTTDGPPPGDSTTWADSNSIFDEAGWDDGFNPIECDIWAQDCPRGEKCMPWANDGGNAWNATRCSPIVDGAGAPGDPCEVEGSGVSGIDTCALGSMCFYVDPETLEGTCVALCTGSEADPMCEDPAAWCSLSSEGVLALCLPSCDPLLDECAEGLVCVPQQSTFSCVTDASGDMGAAGDPCEFLNVCDPGLFCADAMLVPGCDPGVAVGCCSPFCDVNEGPVPCLPGQECVSWWQGGEATPGLEHVGACALPF